MELRNRERSKEKERANTWLLNKVILFYLYSKNMLKSRFLHHVDVDSLNHVLASHLHYQNIHSQKERKE
jgi:hypothetical protein